jgi:2-keto-3-deoxy-L-arabinonate dehydratase
MRLQPAVAANHGRSAEEARVAARPEALGGVVPIVPTPFTHSGDLDLDSLGSVITYLMSSGVHGLAVLGMASEGFALTDAERTAVIRTAAECADGNLPVVAGCSHHSAHAAAQLAMAAQKAGADALMVMPPAMGSPTLNNIADYFAAITAATAIPVVVQDNPGWTGVQLPPAFYERLVAIEGIAYVKVETPHPPTTMREITASVGDRITLLGGLGGNWLPEELTAGSAGTMPASIMPQVYVRIWELWTSGMRAEARTMFHRYHPAIRIGAQPAVGIAMAKQLLVDAGVIANAYVRAPRGTLHSADRTDLTRIVTELGLLDVMRGAASPDELG